MSGPKVVRIVTREEIETICRQLIAGLDEAIEALRIVATRLGRLDSALEGEFARHRQVLTWQFAAEQWMPLQKQAPELTAAVRAQIDRLRAEAVAEAAAARTRYRRMAEGARGLIAALEAKHLPVEATLRAVATRAAFGDEAQFAAAEAAMNAALRQLVTRPRPAAVDAEQHAFAQRLAAGAEQQSLAAWLAMQPQPTGRDTRLDELMAEIALHADARALQSFEDRAAAIIKQTDEPQRVLLIDSLILDAGKWVADRRWSEAVVTRLQEARASLKPFAHAQAAALSDEIAAALASSELAAANRLCAEAKDFAERATREMAAEARRQAVLTGLAALGYEVRAGMATAWAQDGRLVLRKPMSADYGVELGAAPDLARLQIRLVGADRPLEPRSRDRDRDQETIWCGEFSRLQADLAAQGDGLVIERAMEPGVQPVKTIAMPLPTSVTHDAEQDIARPNLRTLR